MAALVGGCTVALWLLCYSLDLPGPGAAVSYALTPRSTVGAWFPARTVAASRTPRLVTAENVSIPNVAVPWHGSQVALKAVLTETQTQAFLWLNDANTRAAWYTRDVTPQSRLSSWSVTKSLLSLLIGQALERGELQSTTRIVEVFPELQHGTPFDEITVNHLLDMTSGIDMPETYTVLHPLSGASGMYMTTDLPAFVRSRTQMSGRPGQTGLYRSVDSEWLGLLLAKRTGLNLADVLSQRLWQPIGAEDNATWNTDHQDGTERAFCCLNASARDLAKVGILVLNGGRVDGVQVVPAAFIERLYHRSPITVDAWGYSSQWWHINGADDDLVAIGVFGQYIYVHPPSRTVIVKMSDYGEEQDEEETVKVFRALTKVP